MPSSGSRRARLHAVSERRGFVGIPHGAADGHALLAYLGSSELRRTHLLRVSLSSLHAYADSWFSYGRVLALLSPAYHALVPDQRGHGDSDKPECCYAADDYAADVDAFMEAVGIEEAILVGDSSGGLIVQRVALDR